MSLISAQVNTDADDDTVAESRRLNSQQLAFITTDSYSIYGLRMCVGHQVQTDVQWQWRR